MSHQILVQLGYASLLIALTFLVHSFLTVFTRKATAALKFAERGVFGVLSDTLQLVLMAVSLFIGHGIAITMWAWLFLKTGVSVGVEEALYFALTTYTTLGFGDVLAPQEWRLLTGFSSANGLMLFGLSAAIIVDATEGLRGRR